jgi:hypothetical protein
MSYVPNGGYTMSAAFLDNLFLSQCLHGKRKAHKPSVWALHKKHLSLRKPFMLHHLMRIIRTPYMHIISAHFPTDMKCRLITKPNTIKKTFLSHCIFHPNAKVSLVDVVCKFQKLQQVKMAELYLQSLSKHLPYSHTRHLQFTTCMAHRFFGLRKKTVLLTPHFLLTCGCPRLFPLQRHPIV